MVDEPVYVSEARKALKAFLPAFEQMSAQLTSLAASDKEMSARVTDLTRLLRETEQRAETAEARASELEAKAKRNDQLDETTRKLIEALNRLPTTMDEAHLIPGSVKPPIALYGTYEWRGVVDAKYWLMEAMKKTRVM